MNAARLVWEEHPHEVALPKAAPEVFWTMYEGIFNWTNFEVKDVSRIEVSP